MFCPKCNEGDKLKLKVIDSREVGDGVRRRRKCSSCSERFTTFEVVLKVVRGTASVKKLRARMCVGSPVISIANRSGLLFSGNGASLRVA